MPVKIGFKLTGAAALEASMLKLSPQLRKKHWTKALRKALRPIVKKAKQNAEAIKDTGALSESIIGKVKLYKGGETAWAGAGPDRGFGRPAPKHRKTKSGRIIPAYYGHLPEFGTSHSPATPYLRPALESEGDKSNAILAKEVDAAFDYELAGKAAELKKRRSK